METKSKKYQIYVLEGVQQGSRQALRTAQAQTLGNSFDCDIYLHDDSESDHQIQIMPGRFSIGITLVSGDAVLDSTSMVVGQKYKLSPGTPVRLGDSLFTIETSSDVPTISSVTALHSDNIALETEDVAEQELVFEESADANVTDGRLINRLYRPLYLVLFIGAGLIGSVFVAWNSGPIQLPPTQVAAETPVVDTKIVSTSALQDIESQDIESQDIESQGSESQDMEIQGMESQGMESRAMENSVIDVFRTYGVDAQASSMRTGIVTVKTTSTNTAKIAAAQASAKADVYGLKKLIVDYDLPEPETIETPKKVVSKAADQEIRMIVIGNPTYVVAENQSRYFKGSKLPTGHRVADIRKGLVVVEKNGVTTELKL